MARWRPTAPPCCWWSLKCQLVVGEAACRSCQSVGAQDLGTLLWCADCDSVRMRSAALHTGRYMGLCGQGGWEVLTVAPCSPAITGNGPLLLKIIWMSDTPREAPQQQSSSSRQPGVTTYSINTDTMWYNWIHHTDRVTISENCNSVKCYLFIE